MPRGGYRKGAGGKKGFKLTKERKKELKDLREIEKAYKQKVARVTDVLFLSQITLARGCTYLYRIDEVEDKKGIKRKQPPVLVESKAEIEEFLADPEKSNSGDSYYYITTEKPDNRAIDSMMDRTYGKATQKVETKNEHVINNIQDIERALKSLAAKRGEDNGSGKKDSDTDGKDPVQGRRGKADNVDGRTSRDILADISKEM